MPVSTRLDYYCHFRDGPQGPSPQGKQWMYLVSASADGGFQQFTSILGTLVIWRSVWNKARLLGILHEKAALRAHLPPECKKPVPLAYGTGMLTSTRARQHADTWGRQRNWPVESSTPTVPGDAGNDKAIYSPVGKRTSVVCVSTDAYIEHSITHRTPNTSYSL